MKFVNIFNLSNINKCILLYKWSVQSGDWNLEMGQGYFLDSKTMGLFPIPEGSTHLEIILENPDLFGITDEESEKIQEMHFSDAEKLSIKKIKDAGWVRLRYHSYGCGNKELSLDFNKDILSKQQMSEIISNFPNLNSNDTIVLDDISFTVREFINSNRDIDLIKKNRNNSKLRGRPSIMDVRYLPEYA